MADWPTPVPEVALRRENMTKRSSDRLHDKGADGQPNCKSAGRFREVRTEDMPQGYYEWCELCKHDKRNGTQKLTPAQVRDARHRVNNGEQLTKIVPDYPVTLSTLDAAVRGETHKDAGGPIQTPPEQDNTLAFHSRNIRNLNEDTA